MLTLKEIIKKILVKITNWSTPVDEKYDFGIYEKIRHQNKMVKNQYDLYRK